MNDVKAVRKVLSLASFFITAPHNSSANRKIERSKISALIVVVGDASASLDGEDGGASLDEKKWVVLRSMWRMGNVALDGENGYRFA